MKDEMKFMSEYTSINALNGHPLRVARCQHNLTLRELAEEVKMSVSTLWRAENGSTINAESRRRLCAYFEMAAQELGLLERGGKTRQHSSSTLSEQPSIVEIPAPPQKEVPTIIFKQGQTLDMLNERETTLEQQLGAWLALETCNISSLFDAGWTLHAILESLRVLLQGVQGLPPAIRRKLLQLSSTAVMNGVGVLTETSISEKERVTLSVSLSKSIIDGWQLFQNMDILQVLSISKALLYRVQQCHMILPLQERSLFYSSTYNLVGVALHLQERYQEALESHNKAHITAIASGNSHEVAKSLIAQADCYHGLGHYINAIAVLEEAFRLTGNSKEEPDIRTKAHILSSWANNLMMLHDYKTAQEKLEASQEYLNGIMPNENFDRASWMLISGQYALLVQNSAKALQIFEEALHQLPQKWMLRRAMTTIGITRAYARLGEYEKSIAIAEELIPTMRLLNVPVLNRWFLDYLQRDLIETFPHHKQVQISVNYMYSLFTC